MHWSASSGAISYDVFRNGNSVFPGISANTLSFYNTVGLVAGTTATFQILARNSLGTTPSNTVFVLVPSDICSAATTPDAPRNFFVLPGNTQNTLSWSPPSGDGGSTVVGYRVFRGTVSGTLSLVSAGGCANLGAVQSCTDAGLTNGQTYFYVVRAVNGVGQGPPSTESNGKPAAPTSQKPVLTEMQPLPVLATNLAQDVTFFGIYFVEGANIILRIPRTGAVYPDRKPVAFASNTFTLRPVLGSQPEQWTVQIINPDGQASNEFPFSTVPVSRPDLVVDSVTFSPSTVHAGDQVRVGATVRNVGVATAPESVLRTKLTSDLLVSDSDPSLEPADRTTTSLAPGASQQLDFFSIVPSSTGPGQYRVVAWVNPSASVAETDSTNNTGAPPESLTVSAAAGTPPTVSLCCDAAIKTPPGYATLTATVGGEEPVAIDWYHDGRRIELTDRTKRTFGQSVPGDYAVVATNKNGTIESNHVSLYYEQTPPTDFGAESKYKISYQDVTFSSACPTVVITHGWQATDEYTGSPVGWVKAMMEEIDKRVGGKCVNILAFTWEGAFQHGGLARLPSTAAAYAETQGIQLALELKKLLGDGYSKGLHLIGHSFGTIVNAKAMEWLPHFQNVHVTLLDPPVAKPCSDSGSSFVIFPESYFHNNRLRDSSVLWVDNYYGNTCVSIYAAVGSAISGTAEDKGYLCDSANHYEVHNCYHTTIGGTVSDPDTDQPYTCPTPVTVNGFDYSIALGADALSFQNPERWHQYQILAPTGVQSVDATHFYSTQGSAAATTVAVDGQLSPAICLAGQNATGSCASAAPAVALESVATTLAAAALADGDATASAELPISVPESETTLTFDLSVTGANVDDHVAIHFGDVLLSSLIVEPFSSGFGTVVVPMDMFEGLAGVLRISVYGEGTAVVTLANLRFEGARTMTPPLCAGKLDGTPCSNNRFCDGEETCLGEVCHAGTAPCAIQNCSEATDTCGCAEGTLCRAALSACDVEERCMQGICPVDSFASSATVCRGLSGTCDVLERCTGSSGTCPADAFLPSSTTCRGAGGVCDLPEKCTGTSSACPGNVFSSSSTTCRSSSGVCDASETCTGSTASCPVNSFASTTVTCRPATSACDANESCSGSSATCPADVLASSTTLCRAAAGPCDSAERCTGSNNTCPANTLASSSIVCRAAFGGCDTAEKCNGTATECPVDTHQPNGTGCDDQTDCTLADSCVDGACSGSPQPGCVIVINSMPELQNIRNNFLAKFVLGRDIDASGFAFTPIPFFPGELDGNGHSVSNLTINLPNEPQVGLFGSTHGTVKNLALINVDITGSSGVGGLTGYNYGTIRNVSVSGSVHGDQCVGGITCFNVSGGGIYQSRSSASVSCNYSAGGLVAQNSGGTIRDSFATGNVTAISSVGGVAGSSSPNSGPSGGLIENVYATGSVTGTEYVGGLIGSAYLTEVTGVYAAGAVSGVTNAGGLIGFADSSPFTAAYWDDQSTGKSSSAAGTAQTTLQLQSGSLPIGFDPAVWSVASGRYPVLSKVCPSGQPPSCDDANPCTQDSCDLQSGCINLPTPSSVCRPSTGVCDPVEICTGTPLSCPSDALLNPETVCRGVAGSCDDPEFCTGVTAACPSDSFKSASTLCRGSAGVCDTIERCSGSAAVCPSDELASSLVTCRPSRGICDALERCTGSNPNCPADVLASSSTVCRIGAAPCDAVERCAGNTASCPADVFSPSTTFCRLAAGPCDVAERCPGTQGACPSDVYLPSTSICRLAAGFCDVSESCPGTSAACPNDQVRPGTVLCREAAGECDISEFCSGGLCPVDTKEPNGTPCSSDGNPCTDDLCRGASLCAHSPIAPIDPPVIIYVLSPGTEGNDVDWSAVTATNADSPTLSFGGESDSYFDAIQFGIDAAPPPNVVERAELWLYATDAPQKDPQLEIFRITEPWTESEVSSTQSPAADYFADAGPLVLPGWNRFDISSLYRDWTDGVSPNYGVKLVPGFTRKSHGHFASSDNPDPEVRPRLVLWGTSTACDDGESCTRADVCTSGMCAGTVIPGCSETLCGDANDDGKLTASDALTALRTAVGAGNCELARCDYNGDGKVNASDALAILRVAVGGPSNPLCVAATDSVDLIPNARSARG
ncbi:MAG TPA: DNRLRE domain-containing protein [Candidatus Limnocylindrales bacterium]|nr:DNRLRE domain-containing protein [Candidatus Limnocylindrales bacterium]